MKLKDKFGNLVLDTRINSIYDLDLRIELDEASSIFLQVVNLNSKRDFELDSIIISDILINQDIIKMMAVGYNTALDDEVIEWIDINNQIVTFNKIDFGVLIKQGSNTIKEIYFKYRKLKDDLS